jgi:hypothetical protein
MGAAFLDPARDLRLQRGKLRRRDGILDHEVAVAPEGVVLLLGQGLHHPLLGTYCGSAEVM